jgi:hypothetical protein
MSTPTGTPDSSEGAIPQRVDARLLRSSWNLPALPAAIGVLALWAEATDGRLSGLGVGLEVVAALVGLGVAASHLRVADGHLRVRFFAPWVRAVTLDRLTLVRARKSESNLGSAPAVDLVDADGKRATVRLGWWESESDLLAILDEAANAAGAQRNPRAEDLLRDRPDGPSWEPGRRRREARRQRRGARTAGRGGR